MALPDGAILVAGATGALGTRICELLRERGADVRAIVRAVPPAGLAAAGVRAVHADLTRPETLAGAVAGARCVVSTATCFPRDPSPGAIERVDRDGTIALIDAAERAGVERFVFVSFKPVPLDFPLQRAKRAVEERLERSRLDSVVLRPGKLMDIWFSPLCGFDVPGRRAAVFGDGTRPTTWIAAADVAEIAARAACGEGRRRGAIELGGPEPLSQREVVRVYEELTDTAWSLDEIAADELERRHRAGADDVSVSLAALMLEAHLGSTTGMGDLLREHPIRLTSVREFAAHALAAGD